MNNSVRFRHSEVHALTLRTLCLLNTVKRTVAEHAELQQGLQTLPIQTLAEQISAHSIKLMSIKNVKEVDSEHALLSFPGLDCRQDLANAHQRISHLIRFLHRCSQQNIKVVLLKGALLAATVYNDRAYKKMNDVDLLVEPKDVARIVDILRTCDFFQPGLLFGENEQDLRNNHHLSPYVSNDLSCVIGIHWHLCSPFARWKPSVNFASIQPINFFGATAWQLSWEENLAHICLHLPYYKLGIRELADVYNICREQAIDWDLFLATTTVWHIEGPAFRVLTMAHAMMPACLPELVLQKLALGCDQRTKADSMARVSDPYCLLHSRVLVQGKIEKSFGIFRISKNFWIRAKALHTMWLSSLCPPFNEAAKICNLNECRTKQIRRNPFRSLLVRLTAGRQIMSAMARDYGRVGLFYLTCANLLIFAKDIICLRFIFPQQDNLAPHILSKLKGHFE